MKVYIFSFFFLAILAVVFGRVANRCPKVDGEYAVSIPNPRDCGSFYKCDGGNAVLTKCAAGLHYNAKKQVCDWPQSAGCTARPAKPAGKPRTKSAAVDDEE